MSAAVAATASQSTWNWLNPFTWSFSEFFWGSDTPNHDVERGIARHRQARAAMSNLDGTNQIQTGISFVGGTAGAALDHAESTVINTAGVFSAGPLWGNADDALDAARGIRRASNSALEAAVGRGMNILRGPRGIVRSRVLRSERKVAYPAEG
jgi:hypothetical protein